MIPRGEHVYMSQCALCHHDDLAGSPPDFPSLQGIGTRMSQKEIAATIRQGRGRMPAFTSLSEDYMTALVHFLVGIEDKQKLKSCGRRASPQIPLRGIRKVL